MVSVFTLRGEDCGWSLTNKTKDLYKIGIHSFAAKHTAHRSKSKDWLAQNQDNVSELSNMSTQGLFSPIIVFFCVMFCRSLFFLFWPLYFLIFFNLRFVITALVSSTFSYLQINMWNAQDTGNYYLWNLLQFTMIKNNNWKFLLNCLLGKQANFK